MTSLKIEILHHLSKSSSLFFLRFISASALYMRAASSSLSSRVRSGPKISSILDLMTPDALFSMCIKASCSPCRSLKKYSVPLGSESIAFRLTISSVAAFTFGYFLDRCLSKCWSIMTHPPHLIHSLLLYNIMRSFETC